MNKIWYEWSKLKIPKCQETYIICALFYFLCFGTGQLCLYPSGGWINIKMSSYQYRKSHCGDKTILRPSYLHNGISYTDKTTSLYWIRTLGSTPLALGLLHDWSSASEVTLKNIGIDNNVRTGVANSLCTYLCVILVFISPSCEVKKKLNTKITLKWM